MNIFILEGGKSVSNKNYPVAALTEQELTEIKALEKAFNKTNPAGEKILIAYIKA